MPEEPGKVTPENAAMRILPGPADSSPRIYANFAVVRHTPVDFTLEFCEVMPVREFEVDEVQKSRILYAPVRARIVIPVSMVEELAKAISDNYEKFKISYPEKVPTRTRQETAG